MKPFENYPDWLLEKWQGIADLLAETLDVPAALIMKIENEYMEVFISSQSENNPYRVGGKEKSAGLYCETVQKTQNKLIVPNALKDKRWDQNPDTTLGMIAFLGFPLHFPDQQPFGTFCVLDRKERSFTSWDEKLIQQFINVIELDLALIQSFELKTDQLAATIMQETAERKQVEESLRINQERLSLATSSTAIGVWDWDIVRNELVWDESMYRLYGLRREDFAGAYEAWFHCVHPDDAQQASEDIQATLRGEEEYATEFRILRADETVRFIQAAARTVRDKDGRPQRMIGINIDITERKRTEEAQRGALLYARSLIEASLDPLVTINSDGKITDVNVATENVTGYTREELIGTDFCDYFTEPQKARASYQQVFRQNSVYDFPLGIRHRDGHITFVLYNASLYKDGKGKTVGVLATARDITERKQAEAQINEQMDELRRWQDVTLGREGRVIELKHEVNQLLAQAGLPPRYPSAEGGNGC